MYLALSFFLFNTATPPELYTLSLHDALPISLPAATNGSAARRAKVLAWARLGKDLRSEEHTSELQSRLHLVCRLLLEKKKKSKRAPSIRSERHVLEHRLLGGQRTEDTSQTSR